MELKCSIQNYAWGKKGIDSMVATLMKSSNPEFIPEDDVPCAELWMGTHQNGPSFLKEKNISLNKYIQENSHVLGKGIENVFGNELPFLFKVLSIKKALSIQIHPNKEQAEILHQNYPDVYKDPNHKPEMAIAITPFEALCGFRPISEIKSYLRSIPEFSAAIGKKAKELNSCQGDEMSVQNSLKNCFVSLMTQEPQIIAQELKKLLERLSTLDSSSRQILNANLFERLHSQYPGDVGCFGIYLFNYIILQPGEAIYLGANVPHAYLSGDCVECMACSDNVVRAGLTPKMIDIETLVEMVSYECQPASTKRFQPVREDECTEVFRPSVQDFAIAKITIPPGRPTYTTIARNTASILIIVNGKAEIPASKILNRGSVIFIEANETITFKVLCACHPMLMFQAFANC